MTPSKLSLAAFFAATAALPALAQEITPLNDYDPTRIEGAWSADQMRDADVYGEDGDLIGTVQNVIVNSDKMVERVAIETDNWLDIGDRVVSVPWDNVDLTSETAGISVSIDESNMNNFSLFGDDETANVEGEAFRASALLDSYVNLESALGYGYVSDLIFARDGTLSSVLVSPDAGFGEGDYAGGVYAYPYYDDSTYYDPVAGIYTLPYTQDEVLGYAPYDAGWTDESI